jgi:hypothetical protein
VDLIKHFVSSLSDASPRISPRGYNVTVQNPLVKVNVKSYPYA